MPPGLKSRRKRRQPPGPNWIRGSTTVRLDRPSVEISEPGAGEDDRRSTDALPRSRLATMSATFAGVTIGTTDIGTTDTLPPIEDEAPPVPAALLAARGAARAPALRPADIPAADGDPSDGDKSTGVFASLDWDEAPVSITSGPKIETSRDRWEPSTSGSFGPPPEPPRRREPVFVDRLSEHLSAAAVRPSAVPTILPDDADGSLDDEANDVFGHDPSQLPPDGDDVSLELDTERPAKGRPNLVLVKRAPDDDVPPSRAVPDDEPSERARPAISDPRPLSDVVVDWPPPMERPIIDYPSTWHADEAGTLVVIDPVLARTLHRRARLREMGADLAAWSFGFVAMFVTGLAAAASLTLVLFALSLG